MSWQKVRVLTSKQNAPNKFTRGFPTGSPFRLQRILSQSQAFGSRRSAACLPGARGHSSPAKSSSTGRMLEPEWMSRMYVCMYVCRYVCMYECMYACMYVCTHVCTGITCTYIYIYVHTSRTVWSGLSAVKLTQGRSTTGCTYIYIYAE